MFLFHVRAFLLGLATALLAAIPTFAAPKTTPTPAKARAQTSKRAASSTKPRTKFTPSKNPDSMESYLELSKNAEPFRRAADEALELLRTGKIDAFVARLSPQMVKTNGGAKAVRAVMVRDIAPFFAKYQKLGNSETIMPASDAYGQSGFSFYLSRVGADKVEKPFAIYILREKKRLVVGNIIPNWTVPKR